MPVILTERHAPFRSQEAKHRGRDAERAEKRATSPFLRDQQVARNNVIFAVAALHKALDEMIEANAGSHVRAQVEPLRTRLNAMHQRHQDR